MASLLLAGTSLMCALRARLASATVMAASVAAMAAIAASRAHTTAAEAAEAAVAGLLLLADMKPVDPLLVSALEPKSPCGVFALSYVCLPSPPAFPPPPPAFPPPPAHPARPEAKVLRGRTRRKRRRLDCGGGWSEWNESWS